ncbi:hypothetical protein KQI49_00815 [Virgibacillus sp. MSJ-26]|uniref:hypothetical protein n=1 Tax=Virgibacillus sp. MSJ-26 TaxID=2841522 RepID=UPI001C126F84|nr:hypothetical protein [Virgibacillus sp. MSJ-26]MBU5465367.1 hypothetical protein [Virgibacillus sp. MSJ-26]
MKNFFLYPFKKAIHEIKANKLIQDKLDKRGLKVGIQAFSYASYLFLIMISIIYLLLLYLIIAGIFVNPIGLIPIIPSALTTWIFILIYTKIYPKTKENYLKSIGYYKN